MGKIQKELKKELGYLLLLQHFQDMLLLDAIAVFWMVLKNAHHIHDVEGQMDVVAVEGQPHGGRLTVPDRAFVTHFYIFFYEELTIKLYILRIVEVSMLGFPMTV